MTKAEFITKWIEVRDFCQKEADKALTAWFVAKEAGDEEVKLKMAENNAYWLAKWAIAKEMLDDVAELEA